MCFFSTNSINITMLKARNLYKSYDDLVVLSGVDIDIKKGEIVSIVGKSGTGKSTLLHILGSLDMPDRGTISIGGQELLNLKSKKLAEFRNRHIGFVFQFHHLLSEFDALENASIPGFISGRPSDEVRKDARELLDYLGLSDRLTHKPGELSGGEQQRVAVARALLNKPDIVFADEPTGNLDTQTSEEIHALIQSLRDDFGQTFVIVTHNEKLAARSDRVFEMIDGKLSERS